VSLQVAAFLARAVRKLSSTEAVDRRAARAAGAALSRRLQPPHRSSSGLVYVELLRHSAVVVQLELVFGARGLNDEDLLADEQLGVALFGGTLFGMLAVVGGSVAHVSPTFTFQELIVRHSFGQERDLAKAMALSLFRQGAAQGYKVVGSMEMLGDPVALVSGMGTGVYQFFRKTGADLLGESETTGEGLKDLLQGVVGGTFGSVAKITGAADDLLSKLGGSRRVGPLVRTRDGRLAARPRPTHVGQGLVQGGERVWRGVAEGLAGIVVRPLEGAASDGVGGFFAGLGRAAVGAVAAPVAGVFGAVSAVSESVESNLKYWDRRPMGRRRDPRAAGAYHLPSGSFSGGGGGAVSSLPLARGALPPLDAFTLLANLPGVGLVAASATSPTPSRRRGPGSSSSSSSSSGAGAGLPARRNSGQSADRSPRRPAGPKQGPVRMRTRTPPRHVSTPASSAACAAGEEEGRTAESGAGRGSVVVAPAARRMP
jgi:hypothetical protein